MLITPIEQIGYAGLEPSASRISPPAGFDALRTLIELRGVGT
jgi:hypothetical protein